MAVIHDLRLVIDGRVAQIDHLLIHRTLDVFVLETKHFHAGLKITENGEFLRWNRYKKAYEGMSSPLAQNERHIEVLKDAFHRIDMPKRFGIRMSPNFHSYVLVSPNTRIDRPKNFDTSHIIKAEALEQTIRQKYEKAGFMETIGSASRIVSAETMREIGLRLVSLHQPAEINYKAKFGIKTKNKVISKPVCRKCGADDLFIQYGRFGYYFKCNTCQGNTPIKIGCGHPGHKERIRKDKRNFYRECADCQTSQLYFVNPS